MKYYCELCDFRSSRERNYKNHLKCHNQPLKLPRIFYKIDKKAYNYIFIHIPKNAGTSVNKVLKSNNGSSMISNINMTDEELNYINSTFHNTLNFAHTSFKNYKVPNKTIFFVRNPFSRVVSLFHFQKLHKDHQFKDFLKKMYANKKLVNYIKNVDHNTEIKFDLLKSHYSWKNQQFWIPAEPFFVGKFENLSEELLRLYAKMKIKYIDQLPHRKKTEHKPYRDYYDKETIAIIKDVYEDDLKRFNYEF